MFRTQVYLSNGLYGNGTKKKDDFFLAIHDRAITRKSSFWTIMMLIKKKQITKAWKWCFKNWKYLWGVKYSKSVIKKPKKNSKQKTLTSKILFIYCITYYLTSVKTKKYFINFKFHIQNKMTWVDSKQLSLFLFSLHQHV